MDVFAPHAVPGLAIACAVRCLNYLRRLWYFHATLCAALPAALMVKSGIWVCLAYAARFSLLRP